MQRTASHARDGPRPSALPPAGIAAVRDTLTKNWKVIVCVGLQWSIAVWHLPLANRSMHSFGCGLQVQERAHKLAGMVLEAEQQKIVLMKQLQLMREAQSFGPAADCELAALRADLHAAQAQLDKQAAALQRRESLLRDAAGKTMCLHAAVALACLC